MKIDRRVLREMILREYFYPPMIAEQKFRDAAQMLLEAFEARPPEDVRAYMLNIVNELCDEWEGEIEKMEKIEAGDLGV